MKKKWFLSDSFLIGCCGNSLFLAAFESYTDCNVQLKIIWNQHEKHRLKTYALQPKTQNETFFTQL